MSKIKDFLVRFYGFWFGSIIAYAFIYIMGVNKSLIILIPIILILFKVIIDLSSY